MRRVIRIAAAGVVVLVGLVACMSTPKPRGPLVSFAFVAGTNTSLAANAVGVINPSTNPQEIRVTVPPATDRHALVATLALSTEAVITVISTGTRVVQENGVTVNDFSVPVTYAIEVPGDKKPWTYRVFVREAETNAQLGTLAVPPGEALNPAFSPTVLAYTVQVPYAATSLQIRAGGVSRTLKSITIDGQLRTGASGTVTVPFQGVQTRTVTIEALAEDGVTRAQYTVTIQRAPPDRNATLDALELASTRLVPAFTPQQTAYETTVPFSARQLVLRAHPQSPVATVTLTSAAVSGGAANPPALTVHGNPAERSGATVDLPPEPDIPIAVVVTAEDGSTQQYFLEVRRAPPDHNADLASLTTSVGTLAPPFSPRVPLYSLILPGSSEGVVLIPAASSPYATVTIAGQPGNPVGPQGVTVPVAPGASLIVGFAVRAEDGSQRLYRVQLTRPPDTNAFLESLGVEGAQLAPAFHPSVIVYSVTLPANAASFRLRPAAQSRLARISVDGRPAPQGPVDVAIAPGSTRIVVIDVTAQNGSTVRYTLRAMRENAASPSQPQVSAAPPAKPKASTPPPTEPKVSTPPPTEPKVSAPPPTEPKAEAPPSMPPDRGTDHVLVQARGLKLGAREGAAMAAAGDRPGNSAWITVRAYRSDTVITRYPARVEASASGKETVIALTARSNGIPLGSGSLVEVETAIPTTGGRFLFYTEAQPAAKQVQIVVPFLLYGDNPRVSWPALSTMVPVAGVISNLPPGQVRAMDKEDFPRDSKGAVAISVELMDAKTNRSYGAETVTSTSGPQRDRLLSFPKPILVPEGATVKYLLSAKARNGKTWTAEGTDPVWTTEMAYPSGFQGIVLAVSDDLKPGKESPGKGKGRG